MKPDDLPRLEIRLTVQPGTDDAGQRLDSFFEAFFDQRQLCASDRPLRDAARELLALGAPPDAMLTARHVRGRRITATITDAAEGAVADFDVDNVVPFRRIARLAARPSGGDAA